MRLHTTSTLILLSLLLFAWGCGPEDGANEGGVGGNGGIGGSGGGGGTGGLGGEAGSGGTDALPRVVSEVLVSPAEVSLFEGDALKLEAQPVDEDGNAVDADVSWSTDDPDIAEVDASGTVSARRGGSATITASAGGTSGSASVTVELLTIDRLEVVPPPTSSIISGAVTIHVDRGFEFTTRIWDSNDTLLEGREVSWRVEEDGEPLEGWVDEAGVVVPRWPGRYQVIASSGGRSAAFTFNAVLRFREVAPGTIRTCALSTGNKAWCWGDDGKGQLGLGQFVLPRHRVDMPQRVAGDHDFKTLAGGIDHSCAIDLEGRAWCWGIAFEGEILADGKAPSGYVVTAREPMLVEPVVKPLASIAARGTSTCAISEERELLCWGSIVDEPWALAELNALEVREMAMGWDGDFVCLRTGEGPATEIFCFGANGSEQVTSDGPQAGLFQRPIGELSGGFDSLTAGLGHVCMTALLPTDRTVCWGAGAWGQIGDRDFPEASDDFPVATSKGMSQLGAGESFTCGLRDGDVFCWGREGAGVGEGKTHLPTQVPLPQKVSSLAVGQNMACALTAEPSPILYCWGDNSKGALGVGSDVDYSLTPMKVLGQ